MELRHLRYFVTVAEELSFSKAASRLYTSQPSLSQQIKDLETELGVKLFNRTKRKVELTEEGEVFLRETRLTLAQAEKAVSITRQVAQAKAFRLAIGFVPVAEMNVFPHILPAFRILYPDLSVELKSLNNQQQIERLRNGELDITFTRDDVQDEEIDSFLILKEPLKFLVPKNHPLAAYKVVPVRMLDHQDFIIVNPSESLPLYNLILAFAEQNHIHLNIVQQADNILLNINLVNIGMGCSILPTYITPIGQENVVLRPLEPELPLIGLYANYRKDNASPILATFIEHLKKLPFKEE
ncbi:DNA-binding transcriptional regulator HcaR [Zobellella sp. An-6]|uniref:DNA-binding transcriptional regulator HcaR n=1 Tax=Zobellella sp. An-6 TaxID=3400218 RepID=UPI0040438080